MTRKDYILIAEALRDRHNALEGDLQCAEGKTIGIISRHLAGFNDAVGEIASALASDNSRFDQEHFLAVVRGERGLNSRPSRWCNHDS